MPERVGHPDWQSFQPASNPLLVSLTGATVPNGQQYGPFECSTWLATRLYFKGPNVAGAARSVTLSWNAAEAGGHPMGSRAWSTVGAIPISDAVWNMGPWLTVTVNWEDSLAHTINGLEVEFGETLLTPGSIADSGAMIDANAIAIAAGATVTINPFYAAAGEAWWYVESSVNLVPAKLEWCPSGAVNARVIARATAAEALAGKGQLVILPPSYTQVTWVSGAAGAAVGNSTLVLVPRN